MRIGILTSGGDCPGINATIRGVCKTAINHYGMEVIGIHSGFQGLLTKDIESFTDKSLSGLLNQGGTMLGTSREKPFKKGGVVSDVDKPALILQNIQEKLLSESLVFLNPEKACQALFHVLLNILQDLSIPYSDDLLIKFIFHTSFALERCIRKEPFVYPKARILIKQHATLFNVLEKNFEIITELFSVQIPASEMGYVIEIFLPYYQQNEQS